MLVKSKKLVCRLRPQQGVIERERESKQPMRGPTRKENIVRREPTLIYRERSRTHNMDIKHQKDTQQGKKQQ